MKKRLSELRRKTAIEAATLLYWSHEKEYKQAKEKAAKILGTRNLPSNAEIAKQMDMIAENLEGPHRRDRLINMRKEAINIMDILKSYSPRLIGSVWRGTVHKNSDIDLEITSSNPEKVYNELQEAHLEILRIEHQPRIKGNRNEESIHIHILLSSLNKAEVIIRESTGEDSPRKCEIYGDTITGLDYSKLRKVMEKNPTQRFLPD
jgi:predicted nucleotidyltransferase